jgi:DNA-binding NtrC family response regulator
MKTLPDAITKADLEKIYTIDLSSFAFYMPTLRERGKDIKDFAEYFLSRQIKN